MQGKASRGPLGSEDLQGLQLAGDCGSLVLLRPGVAPF